MTRIRFNPQIMKYCLYDKIIADTSRKKVDTTKTVPTKKEIIFKVQFATSSEKNTKLTQLKGMKDVRLC